MHLGRSEAEDRSEAPVALKTPSTIAEARRRPPAAKKIMKAGNEGVLLESVEPDQSVAHDVVNLHVTSQWVLPNHCTGTPKSLL